LGQNESIDSIVEFMPQLHLDALRRYAVARSLFAPTTLPKAMAKLGFVQADPIRAPARAQDLTLRLRVTDYCAGFLEAQYPTLALEEDFFVNYGFVPRALQRLMHPRTPRTQWPKSKLRQAHQVLEFVRERGVVHPREVDETFKHGKSRNWFGGSSNASTQLLDAMHYRGLLRVARREGGTRCYAVYSQDADSHRAAVDVDTAMDTLVDAIVDLYAPLPAASLSQLVMSLRAAVPQWYDNRRSAVVRAKQRLPHAVAEGGCWYWPAGENPQSDRHQVNDTVHLLAPFDPIVWDRRRFELLWGWAYRFEAYIPAPRRLRGYYALPLLWRETVIGWANVSAPKGRLFAQVGYVKGTAPKEPSFRRELDAELGRMARFLGAMQ
jgi:uncharacterized protein